MPKLSYEVCYGLSPVSSYFCVSTLARSISSAAKRALGTAQVRHASFKVQDDKDFLEKVENSKEPIIVDFFAT
ncbi:hypothetical protein NQ317_014954 [Molorchus minor]|uniref:Thioredoxin domain-containing protein n=1 Tax=Molorchus minor TaxID=1323400 RepID=A0ABQ9JZF7_9CUCU|nr:hypothetical protein NQ317_014954 [Molorchus minor]